MDDQSLDNGQVPDVLAEFPDGRRFAFEVQYAPITFEQWRTRHEGYQHQGVVDVWLFGHIPPHLRRAPEQDAPRFVLSPVLESVLDATGALHWIHPDDRAISTYRQTSGERTIWSPTGARRYVELSVDDLGDCRVEGQRFLTPTDERIDQEEARRREAAKLAAEAEARRRAFQQGDLQQRNDWKARKDAEKARDWEPLRLQLLERFGRVPSIIEQAVRGEKGIFLHPAHWRALLFLRLIDGRAGASFTYKQALDLFIGHQIGYLRAAAHALTAYLFRLRDEGYVAFAAESGWVKDPIVVRKDLDGRAQAVGDAMLDAVFGAIEAACATHGLTLQDSRLPDGSGMRCIARQDGRAVFYFEVCLDGPLATEQLANRWHMIMDRQLHGYWFALYADLSQARMGLPCFPLVNASKQPAVELSWSRMPLRDFVSRLLSNPYAWRKIIVTDRQEPPLTL